MAAMKDDTPYHQRPQSEVDREQNCMRMIFTKAPLVSHIWESFAGTGVTAEVLRAQFPNAEIEAVDLDGECVETYNKKGYGRAVKGDALDRLKALPHDMRDWGVSLDYNKFTIFDLRETRSDSEHWKLRLLHAVIAKRPAWIELTDSACRYLHLNWRNYDLPKNDIELYIQAVAKEVRQIGGASGRVGPYKLLDWDKHHAASYLLFVRDDEHA